MNTDQPATSLTQETASARSSKIDRAETLYQVTRLLDAGEIEQARTLMRSKYPFRPMWTHREAVLEAGLPVQKPVKVRRPSNALMEQAPRGRKRPNCRELHSMFTRDSYRCSYSGLRLVAPPALVLISLLMPQEFPCKNYPHCPGDGTHIGISLLFPSPDHVEAFASGGACTQENIVTASSSVNIHKGHWPLADLNWPSPRRWPNPDNWNGLTAWFCRRVEVNPELTSHPEYGPLFRSWAETLKPLRA